MKITGITQARIGSTRLPGKVLLAIGGKPLLQYHLEAARRSALVSNWIVATTEETGSERICAIADELSIQHFKGDLSDVLDRFYQCVKNGSPDYVVRITSDCPLIDPVLIDKTVAYTIDNKLSYCITSSQYPDGVDVEVFTFPALREAWEKATLPSDREHVTPYIRRAAAVTQQVTEFPPVADYGDTRFTVDEPKDLEAINTLITQLGAGREWKIYADFIHEHPDLFQNQAIIRNSGYLKSLANDGTQAN